MFFPNEATPGIEKSILPDDAYAPGSIYSIFRVKNFRHPQSGSEGHVEYRIFEDAVPYGNDQTEDLMDQVVKEALKRGVQKCTLVFK